MSRARDAIDRNLLALLSTEARLSTSEIARKLGLARSTVNERIMRMEQAGVILGYAAIVAQDSEMLETRAFLNLSIDRGRSRSIISALKGYPEILDCMTVSGPYELVCTVKAPCAEDIDALIEDLMALDGVQDANATIILASKFDRIASRDPGAPEPLKIAS